MRAAPEKAVAVELKSRVRDHLSPLGISEGTLS